LVGISEDAGCPLGGFRAVGRARLVAARMAGYARWPGALGEAGMATLKKGFHARRATRAQ